MVFVTGATGFIGRHLIKNLIEGKLDLRCLVRRTSDIRHLAAGNIELIWGDLDNSNLLRETMKDCQTVLHIAGLTETLSTNLLEKINIDGTKNMVEAAVINNVKNFIFFSSMDILFKPRNEYAESKYEAERIVTNSRLESYCIIRPSIVYGEGDHRNIAKLIQLVKALPIIPVFGKGNFYWQPLYIGDLAEIITEIVQHTNEAKKTLNIAGPSAVSFIEMLEIICEELGTKRAKFHLPISIIKVMHNLFGDNKAGDFFKKILTSSRDKTIESLPANIKFLKGKTEFRQGIKKILQYKGYI